MRETNCNDCSKFKTLASGWGCCMGNHCEMDVRDRVLEELRSFIDKHYENIFFELKSNGRIEGPNRVLDKFVEQMKGETE